MRADEAKLKRKLQLEEVDARLINWGRWLRHDDTFARLGFPSQSPWVFSPRKGSMVADLDAEHIEWVVSSRMKEAKCPELYSYILRVEYAYKATESTPPVSLRAKYVREHFNKSCAERTYYHHLNNAKYAVFQYAGEIK